MTHTALFKNEIYLIVTSMISIGVLTGYKFFDLSLAVLLILPVIDLPSEKTIGKEKSHTNNADKCASCK